MSSVLYMFTYGCTQTAIIHGVASGSVCSQLSMLHAEWAGDLDGGCVLPRYIREY